MPEPPFAIVECLPEFERDLRALRKKYRSLDDDIQTLIRSGLHLFHHLALDTGHIERMTDVQVPGGMVMFKVVRMACKSLKGTGSRSGMRVIYGHEAAFDRVVLVELYFKGDKENEDRERIKAFLASETTP